MPAPECTLTSTDGLGRRVRSSYRFWPYAIDVFWGIGLASRNNNECCLARFQPIFHRVWGAKGRANTGQVHIDIFLNLCKSCYNDRYDGQLQTPWPELTSSADLILNPLQLQQDIGVWAMLTLLSFCLS